MGLQIAGEVASLSNFLGTVRFVELVEDGIVCLDFDHGCLFFRPNGPTVFAEQRCLPTCDYVVDPSQVIGRRKSTDDPACWLCAVDDNQRLSEPDRDPGVLGFSGPDWISSDGPGVPQVRSAGGHVDRRRELVAEDGPVLSTAALPSDIHRAIIRSFT